MNRLTYTTFIIPTIGRPSIKRTIYSLLKQSEKDWKALIIYDGVRPRFRTKDPRFIIVKTPTKLKSAGLVRNYGIKLCRRTRWISFLDDDDTVSPHYIRYLKIEDRGNPNSTTIIFRMVGNNVEPGKIIPNPKSKSIIKSDVGISFSVKLDFWIKNHLSFTPKHYEDYLLLKYMEKMLKAEIILSSYIAYFVRKPYIRIHKPCVRTVLNESKT